MAWFSGKTPYIPIEQWLGRPPTACYLGHSLLKQQEDFLLERLTEQGLHREMDNGYVSRGQLYADFLDLDESFSTVNFRQCMYLKDYDYNEEVADEILALAVLKPDMLIVNLGGNDLTLDFVDPQELAMDYFNFTQKVRKACQVQVVVLLSCIDRLIGHPNFKERAMFFNKYTEELCDGVLGIDYYHIRGFGSLMEGAPSTVKSWSSDWVHPKVHSKHFHRYTKEIRQAALSSLPSLGRVVRGFNKPF